MVQLQKVCSQPDTQDGQETVTFPGIVRLLYFSTADLHEPEKLGGVFEVAASGKGSPLLTARGLI